MRLIDIPEFRSWRMMHYRCEDPAYDRYPDYGGRGITICERWRGERGFVHFLTDMGPRPSPKHSLDRIDNDGPYSPANCRWATPREQSNNTRKTIRITWDGRTQGLREWAQEVGISPCTLRIRIKRGWNPERALFEPIHETGTRTHRAPRQFPKKRC